MSMELSGTHSSDGNGLSAEEAENRDTLYLMGGAALIVLGAGLILSTPMVRRMLGGVGIGNLISAAAPDFERYLKLRSMQLATDTEVAVYQIDRNTSRFTVRAFATGMLSALGHSPTIAVRDFSGAARLDPEPSLKLRVRAESLEVADDIPSKDRREMERSMYQDVLQSDKYPEIVYESTGATLNQLSEGRWQVNLSGSLTLRGVTRGQDLAMQVTRMGDMLRATGEFALSQSNYGIKPVSVAGGTLKLKDELKLSFDIVARKQEP